ncbi:MAG: hypothetical protein DHS20C01_30590 [marine bacterium B5-7]|nr:MAG: hypothetical protein DHS20C01_30590 [marine bacterium B5-7]
MDGTDPLATLRDIHLPDDPSWWPPAIGWWALVIVLIAVVYITAIKVRSIYRQHQPGRAARILLLDIETRYRNDGDAGRAARSLSELVRRYLLTRFDREVVAGRVGEEYIDLIRSQLKELNEKPVVNNENDMLSALNSFVDAPYRPDPDNVDDMLVVAHALLTRQNLK